MLVQIAISIAGFRSPPKRAVAWVPLSSQKGVSGAAYLFKGRFRLRPPVKKGCGWTLVVDRYPMHWLLRNLMG